MFVTLVKQRLYINSNHKRRVASGGSETSGRYMSPRH